MDLHTFLTSLAALAFWALILLSAFIVMRRFFAWFSPPPDASCYLSLVRPIAAEEVDERVRSELDHEARMLLELGFGDWGFFRYTSRHGEIIAKYFVDGDARCVASIGWRGQLLPIHFGSLLDDGGYLESTLADLDSLERAERASNQMDKYDRIERLYGKHRSRLVHHCDLFATQAEPLSHIHLDRVVACGQRVLLDAYMRCVSTAVPATTHAI